MTFFPAERALGPLLVVLFLVTEADAAWAVGEAKPEPKVVSPTEAVWNPDLSETDPGTLEASEVYKVLKSEPRCSFHYTQAGPPALVAGHADDDGSLTAVIKLHGRLVELMPTAAENIHDLAAGDSFEAEGIVARVLPDSSEREATEDGKRQWPADMRFELDEGLSVGYQGWYRCDRPLPEG